MKMVLLALVLGFTAAAMDPFWDYVIERGYHRIIMPIVCVTLIVLVLQIG